MCFSFYYGHFCFCYDNKTYKTGQSGEWATRGRVKSIHVTLVWLPFWNESLVSVRRLNKQNLPLKLFRYKAWTENEWKRSQCSRKTLKYLQKAERVLKMTRKLGYLEAKHEESKAWSRLYTIIHTYIYIYMSSQYNFCWFHWLRWSYCINLLKCHKLDQNISTQVMKLCTWWRCCYGCAGVISVFY